MKRFFILGFLLLSPTIVFAAESTHRYMIATRRPFLGRMGVLTRDMERVIPERNVTSFRLVRGFAADLTDEEAAALRKSDEVVSVSIPFEWHALGFNSTRNARDLHGQTVGYGIGLVKAPETWPATRGGAINLVILDTGIDASHPDLQTLYAGGFNTYSPASVPTDDNVHGSHCAGIAAAADNGLGVVGVAPGVRLWAVKVLNAKGAGAGDKVLAGLDWVVKQKEANGGNWIASMSFGGADSNPMAEEAYRNAISAGILIIAASGNSETTPVDPVAFPAAYPGVIAVGAVDSRLRIGDFSNQGPEVDLVAPGVDIVSTVPIGKGQLSQIESATEIYDAVPLVGAKKGTVRGRIIDCKLGKKGEFPPNVRGNIALIKRGENTFSEKTKNALEAGASAVAIYNKDNSSLAFTLIGDDPTDPAFDWPVTVAIAQVDGEALLAEANTEATVSFTADDYASFSGTSMATPHVAGAAALVWSAAPDASAEIVSQALISTAHDLGAPGKDSVFGNGLVDAYHAAKLLAPGAFSTFTPPPPPSGRRILRRPPH